ncbi:MAG: response regulator [Ligilactobacillus ruminis]
MVKVLIADDQELIRQSLKIVLGTDSEIEITDSVGDGTDVLKSLEKNVPDVILMDVRMPKMDGTVCTKEVKKKYPDVKIIILTTFDDDDFTYSALKYGASGYILKGISMEGLKQAIMTVHRGGSMINPDIATKVVRLFSQMAQSDFAIEVDEKGSDELTKSEKIIIQRVGQGLSNKEIAGKLYLSEGTVRNNISRILSKLGLRDRTQLAIWAVQTGIMLKNFGGY